MFYLVCRFWALLSDHLYIHRPASSLPFISSFCRGFGKAFYWRGQVLKELHLHSEARDVGISSVQWWEKQEKQNTCRIILPAVLHNSGIAWQIQNNLEDSWFWHVSGVSRFFLKSSWVLEKHSKQMGALLSPIFKQIVNKITVSNFVHACSWLFVVLHFQYMRQLKEEKV